MDADVHTTRVMMRDQLLKVLVKKWFSFQHALQNLSKEEASEEYAGLIDMVNEYEFSLEHAQRVVKKHERQHSENKALAEQQREELEALKMTNSELKEAYVQAKVSRTHHEEYQKLAELISKYPSQEETVATVSSLKRDIEALEQEKQAMESRIAQKNGQFQLLLHSIQALQSAHQLRPMAETGGVEAMDIDEEEEGEVKN